MYTDMEFWRDIRRKVLAEGVSKREICRQYGIHFKTLQKILSHSEPPGYRMKESRSKPKIGPYIDIIEQIVSDDRHPEVPKKQRHTAKRIFERLREEHGYEGGYLALLERKPGALDFARPLEQWELPPCFDLLRRRLESEMDGHKGVREYIKVLRLLENATVAQLSQAIEHSLSIGANNVDAVRLILEHRTQTPPTLFSLDGRPHLQWVRVRARMAKLDLLILDELGYVPASKVGAELLFDIVSTAYERTGIIVTTNLPFENWTEVLGSERLTGATLDRLTHRCHIMEMTGESYRLRDAKKRRRNK